VKLVRKDESGVVIIEVQGKMIGGPENAEMFYGLFKKLVDEGQKNVIVNLSKTPWANSQGVGMLIAAHTSMHNAGGKLVLAHVVDKINDILSVTRLLLIFDTFETLEEAIAHFLLERKRHRHKERGGCLVASSSFCILKFTLVPC